eukprot:SAG22_NODE_184_length_15968_cov_39.081858_9_plen_585_part_00
MAEKDWAADLKAYLIQVSGVFWTAADSDALAAAIDANAEVLTSFGSTGDKDTKLLALRWTEAPAVDEAGEGDEPAAEVVPDEYAVALDVNYKVNSSYLVLVKTNPLAALDPAAPVAAQTRFTTLKVGDPDKSEASPYDNFYDTLQSVYSPFVTTYINFQAGEGGTVQPAQSAIKNTMKQMEQSLAMGRDVFKFVAVDLSIHPEVEETYAKNSSCQVSDLPSYTDDSKKKAFLANLEANVNEWATEIKRVTEMDRRDKLTTQSILREVEFFREMETAVAKLEAELDRPEVLVTKKALQSGGKMATVAVLDSSTGEIEDKKKMAEAAKKLLNDLPFAELKAVTDISQFVGLTAQIFETGDPTKKSAGAPTGIKNKLKRLFLPPTVWTRVDKMLIAMTRDLTEQVAQVLKDAEPFGLPFSDFKKLWDEAKKVLTNWEAECNDVFTRLVQQFDKDKEDNKEAYDEAVGYRTIMQGHCLTFRKRLLDVMVFREEHRKLEGAIIKIAASLEDSDEVRNALSTMYKKMLDVDWLDGALEFAPFVKGLAVAKDKADEKDGEWGKAKHAYEFAVSKVEDVIKKALKTVRQSYC